MARSTETGRVLFTCSLPLKHGLKVYEMMDKMNCGANKVIQELVGYAVERAYVAQITENINAILFRENVEE